MSEEYIHSIWADDVLYNINDANALHLQSNVTFVDKGETITSQTFALSNKYYVITNDHDLGNRDIVVAANCVLYFLGGRFKNGTLKLNNTFIYGFGCFESNVILTGTTSHIDINWYTDDFVGLKNCLALADSNSKILHVNRDLHINFTETIETSSSVDFHNHTIHFNTNFAENPRLLSFCNTETTWLTTGNRPEDHKEIIDLVNSGKIIDYPEKFRNRIIEIYSYVIPEIERYANGPIYLSEVFYVDEYGDMYGHIWNKDIPYEDVNVRMHHKISNEISLRNCNIVLTYTNDGPAATYSKCGFIFNNCVNATIDNVTLFATNGLDYTVREHGLFEINCAYDFRMSNVYCRSTSLNRTDLASSYGIMLSRVVNGLLFNVKSEPHNSSNVWGITGSNNLYNMRYEHCSLNRIDTHWRVVNMNVDHCDIGYYGIRYTGSGIINVTNSKFQFEGLRPREDYATYFDGVINLSNCHFKRKSVKESESSSKWGIFTINPFIAEYDIRSKEKLYLGAKQINIENIYIEVDPDSEVEPSLVSFATNNPNGDSSVLQFVVPNISVRNVTYVPGKKKSLNLIYASIKGVEFLNVPYLYVDKCNDAFTNQIVKNYTKSSKIGMVTWSTSEGAIFDAVLNVSNCNVYAGEEPSGWNCSYRDCVIEGYSAKKNDAQNSPKTFSNCLFRYNSDLIESPFTRLIGPQFRFFNCIFDLPENADHYRSINDFYDIRNYGSYWTVFDSLSNMIMSGCMPSEELCQTLGLSQSLFKNINRITDGDNG